MELLDLELVKCVVVNLIDVGIFGIVRLMWVGEFGVKLDLKL